MWRNGRNQIWDTPLPLGERKQSGECMRDLQLYMEHFLILKEV